MRGRCGRSGTTSTSPPRSSARWRGSSPLQRRSRFGSQPNTRTAPRPCGPTPCGSSRSSSTCSPTRCDTVPRARPSPFAWSRAAWTCGSGWSTMGPVSHPSCGLASSSRSNASIRTQGSVPGSGSPCRAVWPRGWGDGWPSKTRPGRARPSPWSYRSGRPTPSEDSVIESLESVPRLLLIFRPMKILVVEDDRKVAGFIEQGLREEGYAVDVAPDGEEATTLAHVYDYDLVVLDVMLPKKNGLQVAAELRREGRKTPILMLTARDTTEDVVRGLDAGADDYLAKPFKFDELLARVRALVRRGGASRTELLAYGPVELDRLKHKVRVKGQRLELTPKEFQLLEHFLLRPEEVIRRTELLEKVWDLHFDPESNVVDVHVGNLRRKLQEAAELDLLHTVRGVGFRLVSPDREEE